MKSRLNAFLPDFKNDTDDLLVNPERQEKLRIDDSNCYETEEPPKEEEESSDNEEVDEEVDEKEEAEND